MVAGEPHTLCIFDTASYECCDRRRPLSYPYTNVFLVVFSIVNPASFENTKEKVISSFSYIFIVIEINVNHTRYAILQIFSHWQWVPEITRYKAGTPFLLVGKDMELRNDQETIQELA